MNFSPYMGPAAASADAELLCESPGVEFRCVNTTEAMKRRFCDIGQPEDDYGVTFENAQARERTQVLMSLANREGGFVVISVGEIHDVLYGIIFQNRYTYL